MQSKRRPDHLPLTAETIRAAYDYLATTPPYSDWNLPDSEDVKFKVSHYKDVRGTYLHYRGVHTITISDNCVGHTHSLIETMAHEMIHLHEQNARACGRGEHSAAFNKWAEQVCRIHGFDAKAF